MIIFLPERNGLVFTLRADRLKVTIAYGINEPKSPDARTNINSII